MMGLGTIGQYALNSLTFAEWKPVKKVLGTLATPVINTLKQRPNETQVDYQNRVTGKNQDWKGLLFEFLDWGKAVVAPIGIALWVMFRGSAADTVTKDGQVVPGSGVSSWMSFIGKILTGVGIGGSLLGKWKKAHWDANLPPAVVRKLKIAEMQGDKPFLKEWNTSQNKSAFLRYDEQVWKVVKGLHKTKPGAFVQKFITGPPGTGKTEAAKMICERIKLDAEAAIKKAGGEELAKEKGILPVKVKIMDFAQVQKAIDDKAKDGDYAGRAAEMAGAQGAAEVLKQDPLDLMETALATIYDEMEDAKKNSERLVIVLDEVDRIFQMEEIKKQKENGTLSWGKLKLLINRIQKMFDPEFGDILMISNEDTNFFDQLPVNEDAKEAKKGLMSRINNKRVYMGIPNLDTQARIMAAYLLAIDPQKPLADVFDPEILEAMNTEAEKEGYTLGNLQEVYNPVDKATKGEGEKTHFQICAEREKVLANVLVERFTRQTHKYGSLAGREFNEALFIDLASDHAAQCEEHYVDRTRKEKPLIKFASIATHLNRITDNFNKDLKTVDHITRTAESVFQGIMENPLNYEAIAKNVASIKQAKDKTPEIFANMQFPVLMEKYLANVYHADLANGIFYLTNPDQASIVDGKPHIHGVRVIKQPGDVDLNDPANWVVQEFYSEVSPQELEQWRRAGRDAHQFVLGKERRILAGQPKNGLEFMEDFNSLFAITHNRAKRGNLKGIFGDIAQRFEEAIGNVTKGSHGGLDGMMGLLGGLLGGAH